MTKPSPTASQTERAERARLAAEESAEARAHFQARDIAIRENMARLRALRLAKETEDAANATPEPTAKRRSPKKPLNSSSTSS